MNNFIIFLYNFFVITFLSNYIDFIAFFRFINFVKSHLEFNFLIYFHHQTYMHTFKSKYVYVFFVDSTKIHVQFN